MRGKKASYKIIYSVNPISWRGKKEPLVNAQGKLWKHIYQSITHKMRTGEQKV